MKKKISVSKIKFPNCFYHPEKLGKYEVKEGEEIFFLCDNCYQKKSQDGSLDSGEDSQEIPLNNNSEGKIGIKLFRTSSVAQIPQGRGKFSWENWGSFGKGESHFLRKSLRTINGKTKRELFLKLCSTFFDLGLAWDFPTDGKIKMNYAGKDLVLVKDCGRLFLFEEDGTPYAKLEYLGKITHFYKGDIKLMKELEKTYE